MDHALIVIGILVGFGGCVEMDRWSHSFDAKSAIQEVELSQKRLEGKLTCGIGCMFVVGGFLLRGVKEVRSAIEARPAAEAPPPPRKVACPHCQARVAVPQEAAGSFRCPSCKAAFTVG